MKKNSINAFVVQVLKMEDESKWLHSEKVNIFITAIIPAFIGLITTVVTILNKKTMCPVVDLLKDSCFINSMQLVVIVCTILVIFRIRRRILVTKLMGQRLFCYIREKCNLRDQSDESVDYSLNVIRKTMKQFYYAWIALWAILFIYFSGSLCFAFLDGAKFNDQCGEVSRLLLNGYNNVFNYLSSTAMFVVFIILNSATVMINDRRNGRGLICAIILIVIFGCVILLPTVYSFSLYGMSYFKLQLLISIILGFYSAFTFVLVLGRLNVGLHIPRFIFYGLYVYALAQMFQFLFVFPMVKDYCWGRFTELYDYLNTFEIIFQYITLIGKVCLSLTLLWIVFDSKIISLVIQQSQAITELLYRKDVFDTYMKDI